MKEVLVVITMIGFFVAGILVQRKVDPDSVAMMDEIIANDNACAKLNTSVLVAYPVVRLGELRGCMLIPEKGVGTALHMRATFVPLEAKP